MTMGNTIASYRKKLGITQEGLAQQLEVTNQAVSKWESDQCCPDIQLLPKLADIFGITIDELFGREPAAQAEAVIDGLPWKDDGILRAVVYVGRTLKKHQKEAKEITFSYEGPALIVCSDFSVRCGDVQGYVDAGTSVECGNVGGDVDAGTSISCGNVGGDADAGTSVSCGNVSGSVDAGTHVGCGSVGGDVDAGDSVKCGDVSGDVDAGGSVQCQNVEGDVDAGGKVIIGK